MSLRIFKKSLLFFISIILVLGLSISFQSLLAAWTAPTANPPTCAAGNPGCDAPINVGSATQSKIGNFGVTGTFAVGDNMAAAGSLFNLTQTINPHFYINANKGIQLRLDADNNDAATFQVNNGGNGTIFTLDESGNLTVSGNVGIGTTGPSRKFQVRPAADRVLSLWEGNQGQGVGIESVNDANSANQMLEFRGNPSVFTTGNVGIGTTGPGYKLDVAGTVGVRGRWSEIFRYPTGAGTENWKTAVDASGYHWRNETDGVIRMVISNTGNVGIGTTNPSEKLTVAGGHGDTKLRLYSTGNGGSQPANLSLWASEPGWTYTGTGIGYNVNGSPYYGRIDNARGSSYVRFLPGETKFEFKILPTLTSAMSWCLKKTATSASGRRDRVTNWMYRAM